MIRIDHLNDKELNVCAVGQNFPIQLTGKRTGHRWALHAQFGQHAVIVKAKITLASLRTLAEDVIDGKLSAASPEFKDLYEYCQLSEKWPAVLGYLMDQSQPALVALGCYKGITPMDWLAVADRTLQSIQDGIDATALAHFGHLVHLWKTDTTVLYPNPPEESALQEAA